MASIFKKILRIPETVGPAEPVKEFSSAEPISSSRDVVRDGDSWLIESRDRTTVRLFHVPSPKVEKSKVTYRASLKTEKLDGRAYLEMSFNIPGQGSFTMEGMNRNIAGTTGWVTDEIPLHLKKGQEPERIELKVTAEGKGKVWIKDIELTRTPMNF